MTTITVNASGSYPIHIGPGVLDRLAPSLLSLGGIRKVCVVSDSHVFPLYGASVLSGVRDAGLAVCSFVLPAGEASKNGTTLLSLLDHLAREQLTRTDAVIALGGGVVGDLAGFAAAVFLRGIRYIQIPTTLLAAVDSSVGGKTAINLPGGKNLAGAFYQPSLVLCDTDTLKTLPEEIFRDGCAEVIKYAVLFDPELFSLLEKTGLSFDQEQVIARCVRHKKQVVEQDEHDRGCRQLLNLGHTMGHGIEALSGFTLSHGQAVAIGTAMVSGAAAAGQLCSPEDRDRILSLLTAFGLPVASEYETTEVCNAALSDKKRSGDTIALIVPEAIGKCRILSLPVSRLLSFLETGSFSG